MLTSSDYKSLNRGLNDHFSNSLADISYTAVTYLQF